MPAYDALLVVSFGGPEKREDVLPFLRNVLRGRNVPEERLLEVAEHYYHFGGRSPINEQVRQLIDAVRVEFLGHHLDLPVYWGNRNWHPFLLDAIRQMHAEGVQRVLALVTSAFASYSGCRQYSEDIARARAEFGPDAPAIDKIRTFFNHPGFVEASADRVRQAFACIDERRRLAARLIFSAHSIPVSMSQSSPYVEQLKEAGRLIGEAAGRPDWELVYQSRSGPPGQPWLEPDVNVRLRELAADGAQEVVLFPLGFLSDHMEVVYDLDTEARASAESAGLNLIRAGTVGTHPRFISAIRELVEERLNPDSPRLALGWMGAPADVCDGACCPAPARPSPSRG